MISFFWPNINATIFPPKNALFFNIACETFISPTFVRYTFTPKGSKTASITPDELTGVTTDNCGLDDLVGYFELIYSFAKRSKFV